MRTRRSGQTLVEYMLVTSVLVLGVYIAFASLVADGGQSSVSQSFKNAREVVQQPYP